MYLAEKDKLKNPHTVMILSVLDKHCRHSLVRAALFGTQSAIFHSNFFTLVRLVQVQILGCL